MKKFKLLPIALISVMLLSGCSGSSDSATVKNIEDYITLGQYKGLEYTLAAKAVTDEDVANAIENILSSTKTTTDVTGRGVKNGDIANIDYEGLLDGKAFDGGTAKGYDLTIGSNAFIPGFESQLIGAEIGKTVNLDITFPADYGSADLAGKAVVFVVTVNSIKEEAVPELTKEFVIANSEFETVEEYKEDVKTGLQTDAAYGDKLALLDQIVSSSTIIKYPQDQINKYVDSMIKDLEQNATQYNMSTEEFLNAYLQMTMDEFKAESKIRAEKTVSEELVMLGISKAENIKISNDEYKDSLEKYTKTFGFESTDDLVAQYGKDTIKNQALFDKVLDFVLENATAK
ncbi:MAG: trigger factor [Proteocatella sp.]